MQIALFILVMVAPTRPSEVRSHPPCRRDAIESLKALVVMVVLALLSSPTSASDRRNVQFNHVGSEELALAAIKAIRQDSDGFIWLASEDGLLRYDGHQFESFLHDRADPDSLSHDGIRALTVDRQGRLWVGTDGGGLNLFDAEKGQVCSLRARPGRRRLHQPRPHSSPVSGLSWDSLDWYRRRRTERVRPHLERLPAPPAQAGGSSELEQRPRESDHRGPPRSHLGRHRRWRPQHDGPGKWRISSSAISRHGANRRFCFCTRSRDAGRAVDRHEQRPQPALRRLT